jgi:septum formation protein
MPHRLILASTSSARRALMDSLRIPYEAVSPGVEEDVPVGTSAHDAVALLSVRKARAVQQRHPDALVLGADQLVALDGERLGKPPDRAAARRQLQRMAGRTHEIVTGLALLGPGIDERAVDVVRMTLYPLSAEELERYLDTGEWEGCAGSYRVEAAGQALFSDIAGDRTSVQGLPMLHVVRMLRKAGVPLF